MLLQRPCQCETICKVWNLVTSLQFIKLCCASHVQNYEKRKQHRPLDFPPEYLLDDLATESTPKNKYCEVIHIGVVCSGYNSNVYFHTLLKSLYFYRANPIHFHIVVNKISWRVLKVLFDTWNVPEVSVTFYDTEEYVKDVRWVPNTHYSGAYGLMKLLFPKIVPLSVTRKIIILDTDLTVVGDIYNLWKMFQNFNKRQAIGLVENQSEYYLGKLTETAPWPAIDKGFNTGVILFDLLKLKHLKWDKLWSNVTKRTASVYGATGLADQDIINAVIKENPHVVYKVPCYWNTQMGDNSQSSSCYKIHKVKIVHWNSPRKYNVQHQSGKYFRSLATSFLEYNGNLLRNTPLFCIQTSQISTESFNDNCSEFRRDPNIQYRTLLFFREFKYEISENDVTLVSQLSFDRLRNIEDIVRLWKGPIAFTFYLTDFELVKVAQFISESDILQERLNVAYHAVFKEGDMYPVNYLRNTALRNVKTPFVFLSDIDFQPMHNMYDKLKEYLTQNMEKKALIVPAFEVKKSNLLKMQIPLDKSSMLTALHNDSINPFRSNFWPSGHGPMYYDQWTKSALPYKVTWKPDFEPYIVVKSNVVEYSEEFLGFGWNKVSHIMELEAQNYEFVVLPDVFMIHKNHGSSPDNIKYRNMVKYRRCLNLLKKEFIKKLNKIYNRAFEIPTELKNIENEMVRLKRDLDTKTETTTTLYDSTDFYMVWGGKEKYFGKKFTKQALKAKDNPLVANLLLKIQKEQFLSDLRNYRLGSSGEQYSDSDYSSNSADSIDANSTSILKSVIDTVAILEEKGSPMQKSENLTIINVNANEDLLKNIADNIDFAVNIDLSGTETHGNGSSDDFEDYEAYDYVELEKHYRDKFSTKPSNMSNKNNREGRLYSDEDSEYTSEEKKVHKPATPIRYAPEVEKLYQESLQRNYKKNLGDSDKSRNATAKLSKMENEKSKIMNTTDRIPSVSAYVTSSTKNVTTQEYEDIYEEFRVKFKDFDKIPRQN